MKNIKLVTVIFLCCLTFGCKKSNDTNTTDQDKKVADEQLITELKSISAQYSHNVGQDKKLGTFSGFCVDVAGAAGGCFFGSAFGPIGTFVGGMVVGVGCSMAEYNLMIVDPCTGQYISWYQYQQLYGGQGNPNTPWQQAITKYSSLAGNNSYSGMGVFHNYSLDNNPCNYGFTKFNPSYTIDSIIKCTTSFFANNPTYNNFDYSLITKNRNGFLAVENCVMNFDPTISNPDVIIMSNLAKANMITDSTLASIISQYMAGAKTISDLNTFGNFANSFDAAIMSSNINQNTKNNALLCTAIGRDSYIYWFTKN